MGCYIPGTEQEQLEMLKSIGFDSFDGLFSHIPQQVRLEGGLNLPEGLSELEVIRKMADAAEKNTVFRHIFRGAGAYNHYIPAIVGSVTGKEEFVTAYTPYQAEISQGILQSIFEYQTMICELTGMDASNAVYSTTYETDEACGTHYFDNFVKFWTDVQENDWAVDGAMTDVKGDRSLSPSKQADPDLFLHVVERTADGVYVTGAKAHQTGYINSHYVLVMPTISMREGDEDYAISFACPTDAEGITLILGRQSCDTRKTEEYNDIDVGNKVYGGHEVLVIFDHVFIPNEMIFLNGEVQFAGMMVERFAGYHRQSYGGCKVGVGDVLIGATALAGDMAGSAKASHVKDKLIEMTHLNETLYCCGIACSSQGTKTKSGNYLIDLLLANVCKQNVTRFPYEIARLAQDLAGGLMVTQPSEADYRNPATHDYIEKYLKGVASVPTEDRMRVLRLIENMTMGTAAVGYLPESMHGAGSPQAQRIMIARQSNLEMKKELAKKIARIK